MLQDIENNRRTEIDNLNGIVVSLASKYRLEVPLNNALTIIIKGIERTAKQ
jgi:2-dehydropantoate 2-reductase